MDFTFCQLSQVYILKSDNVVPNSFISTSGEMNMEMEYQACVFKSISPRWGVVW